MLCEHGLDAQRKAEAEELWCEAEAEAEAKR